MCGLHVPTSEMRTLPLSKTANGTKLGMTMKDPAQVFTRQDHGHRPLPGDADETTAADAARGGSRTRRWGRERVISGRPAERSRLQESTCEAVHKTGQELPS